MIKTAVIGATGFIGSHLFRQYRAAFSDCIGTSYSKSKGGLISFDLKNTDIHQLKLMETDHQAVIISAMSNVNWCEAHPTESRDINVSGTLRIIKALSRMNIKIIFLSSGYVFNGRTRSKYQETEKTCPITEYGKQKAEVEKEIPNLTNNYLICRLSKIYGTAWKDNTLIDEAASSLLQGKIINAADDQYFSPTHVDDVVSMILYAQQKNINGLVNLCNSDSYSRYHIVSSLAKALQIPSSQVKKVSLNKITGMENRPLNTSLQSSQLFHPLQCQFISIDNAIKQVAQNWTKAVVK
ncbi:MAG: hypothetical protein A3C44_03290 [Gammaproteobacteria bacterium RIFCSPHIGHO2_02_FULL_39_13]|nr:MAG: hypothetical protein A3C44_03290 [Gammaproteobacteria bacterium RIFCSPHIGHO2_02_FULL_39_13]OGT48554.1 MAG: hypothetical protein A3E53_04180 [Gammaproteobacteria bacterium RIFCSPHIGHO2_12_FULL_39_24]